MATDFLGLQMVITLRDPSERLCGSVCGVVAGQSLTLRNGEHGYLVSRSLSRSVFTGLTRHLHGRSVVSRHQTMARTSRP